MHRDADLPGVLCTVLYCLVRLILCKTKPIAQAARAAAILPENADIMIDLRMGRYVALPKAYLTSAKHLPAILNAIQTAKAPPQFNQQFLKSLEFGSPSDRQIIGVLKALKFINHDGAPTERYYAFQDQVQAPGILADGIRSAYADLFQLDINAQNLTKSELIDKFWALSESQLSDLALNRMAVTFIELCKLADFQTPAAKTEGNKDNEGAPDRKIREKRGENVWEQVRVGGLRYRVQIEPGDVAPKRTRLIIFLTTIIIIAVLIGLLGIFWTFLFNAIQSAWLD